MQEAAAFVEHVGLDGKQIQDRVEHIRLLVFGALVDRYRHRRFHDQRNLRLLSGQRHARRHAMEHQAVFQQRFAVIRQIDEHVRNAGAIQRLDDFRQDMIDVEDGVVVRVVELLERALVRHVGVVAQSA